MVPAQIRKALSRLNLKEQDIRLRKILTTSLISTLVVIIGPAVDLATAPAANADASTSAAVSYVRSTTGGGGDSTDNCATGYVVSTVYTEYVAFDASYAMTNVLAGCRQLSADGLTKGNNVYDTSVHGGSRGYNQQSSACGTQTSNGAIIGARVYKTQNGYASGVQLICSTLPDSKGSAEYWTGTVIGTNPLNSWEDIKCAAGSVAIGLYLGQGSILDKFGFTCGNVTGATQTITFSSLANKTYGESVSLSASSSSGLSVVFSSATTSVCTVNGTTVTLVATGTCTINANQSGNTNWGAANQVQQSFTVGAAAALTPTFGTVTRTAGGFTVPISNFNNSYGWAGTGSAGVSVAVSGTGVVTVTGVAAGVSETISITSTRSYYNNGTATVSGTALSSRASTFGVATRQSSGFTVPISNYDNTFTYETLTSSAGSASLIGSNIVVTGLTKGAGATVSISTRKSGYLNETHVSERYYALETATALTLTSKTMTAGIPYKILYSADSSNPNKPTYTSSTTSVCTVSGETITPLTSGTCTISASLAGYSTFDTATATSSFTVNAAVTNPGFSFGTSRSYISAQETFTMQTNGGTGPFTLTVVKKSDGQAIPGITVLPTYDFNANIHRTPITIDQYTGAMSDTVTITSTDANGSVVSHDTKLVIYKALPVFTLTPSETETSVSKQVTFTVASSSYNVTGTMTLRYYKLGTYFDMAGCTNIPLVNGGMTCTWSSAIVSNAGIYANYSGDSNYLSGAEASLTTSANVKVNDYVFASYSTGTFSYGTGGTRLPISVNNGTGNKATWTWDVVKTSDSTTVSGISMNLETITVSASVPVGTYNLTVRVTDSKGVISHLPATIVVNKGTTSFTLSADTASATVGKSINITFTSSKANANGTIVLYESNQSTIASGCSSISIVNGTGTCSWTRSSAYGPLVVYWTYSGDSNYFDVTTKTSSTPLLLQFFPRTSLSYGSTTTPFGTAASFAGTYLAKGGGAANTWTWSIVKASDSSTVSGISMNMETITVSNSVPAGTYAMRITTVDGLGDVTTKDVTVTVSPLAGITPTFGTVTRTNNGFTTSITNYDANYTFTVTTSAGTVETGTASGLVLPITVTGLADSASATVTVSTTRLNYTSLSATVTGTSLAVGIVPSFGTVTKTATGFTVSISNYSASYTWTETVTVGSVSAGVASGANRTYTITGLSPGQSATLTVANTSAATKSTSASLIGTAKAAQAPVTVTQTSGTYPSETLTATGGSGTGSVSFALAGPASDSFSVLNTTKNFSLGATTIFSPDNSMLYVLNSATSGNSTLRRYVVGTNTYLSDILLPTYAPQMSMAPDGTYLLVVNRYGVTKILTSTGETSTLVSGLSFPSGIAIDPTGTGDFYITNSSNTVIGYSSSGVSKFTTTVDRNAGNYLTSFYRAAISLDGTKFYVTGKAEDGSIYEFNTTTGALIRQKALRQGATEYGMNFVAITPDGNYLLALNSANVTNHYVSTLYKLDIANWSFTSATVLNYDTGPVQLSISPDSSFALIALSSQYSYAWRFAKVQLTDLSMTSFGTPTTQPASTAISSDGTYGFLIPANGIQKVILSASKGSAVCSIAGSTISARSAGTCKVVANKAEDLDYATETSTVTTFTFSAAPALTIRAIGGSVNYKITSQYTPAVSLSGFVSTDSATVSSPTYRYVGVNGTSYASSTTKPIAVGTYSVTPSDATITFSSGYLTGYASPVNYVSDTLTVLATVSDSVTAVSAVATSSTSATVSFTAPAANKQGGSAITSYLVSNGVDTVTATGASSPISISGLSPGTAYAFRVNAINSVGRSDTATAASITMPLGVTISPTSNTGIFGVPISTITPTVRGGSGITYSISPSLPAGLTLNVNGTITGTPTETSTVKTYTETATATGTSGSATFTLTISKATTSISVATISPITPVLGSPITFTSTITTNTQATLTGTISFKNAANSVLCSTTTITAGVGSCDFTPITTETFTVRSFYSGMTYVDSSTSLTALTVVPTKGNPSVSVAASPVKLVLGSSTTLTTTITTGTSTNATGQVAYSINSTSISGCSAVNVTSNAASCSYTPTTSGVFEILATYIGDANYNGVVASTVSVTVSSCTQSQSGLTLSTGAPAAGYCAVAITAGSSGSLGLPVGVLEMKTRILIIGGGGAGGSRHGGGGGAGGVLYAEALTLSDTNTVTIGAGGAATNYSSNNGNPTTFGSATAAGGGGGGGTASGGGYAGGSGGGASATNSGGSGTQSSVTGFVRYKNNGASGTGGSYEQSYTGGGGGGAGSNGYAGASGTPATPGKGGDGIESNMTLTGAYACFAAGGAGGQNSTQGRTTAGVGGGCSNLVTATVGGAGNVGTASNSLPSDTSAQAGAANTGSGGGGSGFSGGTNYYSGAGGSGLVALRYISPTTITVPADTSTVSRSTVTFVAAAPAFLNLFTRTYQWQKLIGTTWTSDTSTSATTLTFTFVAQYAGVSVQKFRLLVTDSDGALLTKTASRVINLTVAPLAQPDLVVASTFTAAGASLTLFTYGGAGTGAITYSYVSSGSAAGCSLNGAVLSLAVAGICKVVATKAADLDYLNKRSETATVSFVSFQMTVQTAPTNTITGIFTSGSTTTTKGAEACVSECTPKIASLSISTGRAGDSITLSGEGFTGATAVTFDGSTSAASFTVVSDSQITLVVPSGLTAGENGIDVTTPGGISPRNFDFELLP